MTAISVLCQYGNIAFGFIMCSRVTCVCEDARLIMHSPMFQGAKLL